MKDSIGKNRRASIDLAGILMLIVTIICIGTVGSLLVATEMKPLTVQITNTSDDPLPFELYADGIYKFNDTIEPKTLYVWEYKNGFWGPGNTQIVVKLPNTLFEKEGLGGHTVSFVFE